MLISAAIILLIYTKVRHLSKSPVIDERAVGSPRQYKDQWLTMLHNYSELSSHGGMISPVIFKMTNFSNKIRKSEQWNSSYFFAFARDYSNALSLSVTVHRTYISVYILSLYEVRLYGMLTVQILNQTSNIGHYTKTYDLYDNTGKKIEGDVMLDYVLCGDVNFISIFTLHHSYLRNDMIYYKVLYDSNIPSFSNRPSFNVVVLIFILLLAISGPVCYIYFTMHKFLYS